MSPSVQFKLATVLLVFAVGGCASSLPGFYGPDAPLAHDAAILPNGQPYATATSTLADLEGAGPIQVRVVRSHVDLDTGITKLLVSDEFLTLSLDGISNYLGNISITIDGETLHFVGHEPTGANDLDWGVEMISMGEASGTGDVFTNVSENKTAPFDTEAFFAFGFQTNPAEIEALRGSATYVGDFRGWGPVLDPGSNLVLLSETEVSGEILLFASFDGGTVDGGLDGIFAADDRAFTALFFATIEGNGFSAPIETFYCDQATCTSRSEVAGVFYGADALETSGIIGLDVTVRPEDGVPYRFVSGGVFTAVQ